jgi:hypothetical protein
VLIKCHPETGWIIFISVCAQVDVRPAVRWQALSLNGFLRQGIIIINIIIIIIIIYALFSSYLSLGKEHVPFDSDGRAIWAALNQFKCRHTAFSIAVISDSKAAISNHETTFFS